MKSTQLIIINIVQLFEIISIIIMIDSFLQFHFTVLLCHHCHHQCDIFQQVWIWICMGIIADTALGQAKKVYPNDFSFYVNVSRTEFSRFLHWIVSGSVRKQIKPVICSHREGPAIPIHSVQMPAVMHKFIHSTYPVVNSLLLQCFA